MQPNRGAWVAKLDLEECLEIYKIRERLEPLVLSEAVAKITDAEIDSLEALVIEMTTADGPDTFLRLDRASTCQLPRGGHRTNSAASWSVSGIPPSRIGVHSPGCRHRIN